MPIDLPRFNPAVVEFDDSIRKMKIAIVVRDHERRLVARLQIRQQLRVEDLIEQWILI